MRVEKIDRGIVAVKFSELADGAAFCWTMGSDELRLKATKSLCVVLVNGVPEPMVFKVEPDEAEYTVIPMKLELVQYSAMRLGVM